ncbi:salivary peroxidase/catechol oxidase-like [Mytilus galloprovincialis]|uniref:salivary peroxidase/catechol oxidase-like n=1 Tax=Mytilus galloprovincialis TaxID=29158 RepID=UPI003F7C5BE7
MQLNVLWILVALFVLSTAKSRRKTHKQLVKDCTEYGKEQLSHFKKKNQEGEDIHSHSFDELRWRKQESSELEYAAILTLEATKKLKTDTGLCLSELQNDPELLEIWTSLVDCRNFTDTCDENYPYRSADGSCNNVDYPEWGKSFTPQERFIPAHYEDGIEYPRDYDLPSPRLISNKLFNDTGEGSYDKRKTAEMMAWGQLLAHDFVLTPTIAKVDCCDQANEDNPACFTIEVPEDDAHFTSTCMNFVRSSPATVGCVPGHREQVNELTAYIDGSMLYGSTKKEMDGLREFSGGRMRCTDTNLLPANPAGMCLKLNHNDVCQAAGDSRVDVVPNLGGNHILLMREHNRIADELAVINHHWDDERVFQETRKIIAAMIQHISYNEYLPGVIGPDAMTYYDLDLSPWGHDDPYDPDFNPSIRNAFAAAAFRFGHSQVMPEQAYLFHDYVSFEHYPLEKEFMNTHMIQKQEGKKVPALMRWLSYDKAMDTDRFFVKEIRDLLFLKNGKSSDLPAINIQRGRDHGLPSYNAFREHCGLSTVSQWNPNADEGLEDHRWSVTRILKDIYQNVEDIDLFAGAITEKKVHGGLVGPTFACLIGEQFEALKKGDRFWYETPDSAIGFTDDQLHSIKRMKLSKLFCENFGLHQIQRRIFNVVSEWNGLVPCSDLPDINLQLWREH